MHISFYVLCSIGFLYVNLVWFKQNHEKWKNVQCNNIRYTSRISVSLKEIVTGHIISH